MKEKDISTCFRLAPKSTIDEKTLMIYHKQRALEAYKWIINDTKKLLIPSNPYSFFSFSSSSFSSYFSFPHISSDNL